ncbi:Fe(2+) transporter permease subunit FeoB [Piscirickettsia salmonis]|nr:Fe(2+) transporter permease subunit FeoB [Piscirickettsia salmonis]APS57960.1 ferrous iron transporter B [Piscirickettsia salmonis]ERL62163.1 ferrous iron transport protein B [Piscirickettsia salmonis LF-89 = ATCC VR-1361]PEQ17775.1 Fe(2+) transporter permease subunit FeoB [Piscirickettsia salmonis]QGN76271.1 Ferrous iron transport protein B [Piscirickettsia salmonis]QGN79834.1 Ferrous iron transport protein B [Piscirickettsia salmonis]
MKHIHIALLGNPNSGKTTLFNQLTGSKQKVGNWAGVTVEKKTGSFAYQHHDIQLTDLPGTYSLNVASAQSSLDERIACEYLLQEKVDLVINIVDAANLERNLYLTSQLLEMRIPCIIALNMLDIAKLRKININSKKLSEILGCPVIELVSNKNQGTDQLKAAIINHSFSPSSYQSLFSTEIEQSINQLVHQIDNNQIAPFYLKQPRWLATRLLEQDTLINSQLPTAITLTATQLITHIEKTTDEEADILIADARYQQINTIIDQVTQRPSKAQRTLTQRLDNIVMNRWLGIPIFLFLMYWMFLLSINIGGALQPLFQGTIDTIFIDGVSYLGQHIGLPRWITAIAAQGFGSGLDTVAGFIPQIGLMFLFLSFLEDSGYMARAAFVMDRFMQAIGLPGKSFVPLIVGFGCNVPAIMATRTLETRRDRIMTAMMAPFISCGARLAIFAVFSTAFFTQGGALVVFSLYLLGIIVAITTGLLLKKSILRGDASPFIMELPAYHAPHLKSILMLTWNRLKSFVIRAGKIIVPVCILIGSLNSININGSIDPDGSRNSILSKTGKIITPIFTPMGIEQDNWPATVGLITGTLAKEVVIGTLNTLYSQQTSTTSTDQNFSFWGGIKSAVTDTIAGFSSMNAATFINPFEAAKADGDMDSSAMGQMVHFFGSPIAVFAYLVFALLYIPCIATIGALSREIGRGWAYLSTYWGASTAYSLAVITYQAGSFSMHPTSSSAWIIGLILFQGFSIFGLIQWSKRNTVDLTQPAPININKSKSDCCN